MEAGSGIGHGGQQLLAGLHLGTAGLYHGIHGLLGVLGHVGNLVVIDNLLGGGEDQILHILGQGVHPVGAEEEAVDKGAGGAEVDVLGALIQALGVPEGTVVEHAVNRAVLQAHRHVAGIQGGDGGAIGAQGVLQSGGGQRPDGVAGEIADVLDGEGGQDVGAAAQQPAAHLEAVVVQIVIQAGAGGEDLLGLSGGSAVGGKQEGQIQNGNGGGIGGKVGGGDQHALDGAVLHAVDHLGRGAQLAGGIELYGDGAAGGLLQPGLEFLHGHILLMLAAGGRTQADGVAAADGSVAGTGTAAVSGRRITTTSAGGQHQGQGQCGA